MRITIKGVTFKQIQRKIIVIYEFFMYRFNDL